MRVVAPDLAHVHTRIATSTDRGLSWTYLADVNDNAAVTVDNADLTICGQRACVGTPESRGHHLEPAVG